MENLDGFSGSGTFGKNDQNINVGRLCKALNISSFKDIVTHIAMHYGISVSFVHKEYSSQECSHCGYINELNRLSQESFKCVECGYEDNADSNAAKVLKFRLTSTVLKNQLLEAMNTGYNMYLPKKLPYRKVKCILEKCRYDAHDISGCRKFDQV